MSNIIRLTDSYKVTHWKQYPKGTRHVYSYLESRGGEFKRTAFFGLQYIIKKYLAGQRVTLAQLEADEAYMKAHFGNDLFNYDGWKYIATHHGGRLPVEIRAVLEGSSVDTHNVLMTIVNTDPNVPWLTNYLETLLCQVWYPTTVCTNSKACKELILFYLDRTGDPSLVDFKLHDFGFRGSSSVESSAIGDAAHLVNFMGTDTLSGIDLVMEYYNSRMPAFSIPASEHSTITSWGEMNEADAHENMLDSFPDGLVASVSDSWDIFRCCERIWGTKLKDKVLSRNGTLVIRPDSGRLPDTVLAVLQILGDKFGVTYNSKGYKVLPPQVRVIQGDGVNRQTIDTILRAMMIENWSADNIAFGSGGALLQKFDRDTCRFAFKCSAINIDGEWRDVYKQPVTDSSKNSKKGMLSLNRNDDGSYYTTIRGTNPAEDHLHLIFRDGELLLDQSFDEIRRRANDEL